MKKFIAILLVLVIGLFAFTACNKEDNSTGDYGDYKPVEKFDGDKLKETWSAGEITFANKNKIVLPCTIDEFLNASGLRFTNEQAYENKQFKPGESFTIPLVGTDTQIKIDCQNLGSSDCGYLDTTVVGFNFFNSAKGNRAITVAAGLTVGITRADVEKALGIPEGKTSEDRLYTYKVELENKEAIRLSVSFNSSGIVNSISYDLDK
jgi:hypothetical protein